MRSTWFRQGTYSPIIYLFFQLFYIKIKYIQKCMRTGNEYLFIFLKLSVKYDNDNQ